jgi:fibronectin type 3 domain-containing protein
MRKISLLLLIMVPAIFVFAGCSRHVDSLDPVRSIPEPLDAPVNLSVLIGNQAVTLTWEMTDPSNVAYYRIYLADSADSDFRLRDTTTTLSGTISGLLYNQKYTFEIAAVRTGGNEGKRSSPVSVRVPALSVVIKDNAEFTKSQSVNVTLNGGLGASEYQLSEDSTFASAPIENFSSQVPFSLSAGDGKKRLYARYYYSDGSRTNGLIYDEITLDTKAAISSFSFSPTTTLHTADVVTFTLNAGESKGTASVSFVGAPTISLYDDGAAPDATANDGIYTGRWVVPVGVSASGEEVAGAFIDAAGNEALQLKASTLITIQSSPAAVSIVSALAISTYQIEVHWTTATSPNFRSYQLYRAPNAGVSNASTLVTTIDNKNNAGYTDTTLDANTMYYYRVYVIDSFGLTAASNVDSARTQVNTAPAAVVLAGTLSADSSTFKLSWTKSTEQDFASYRLYRKNSSGVTTSDQLVAIINNASSDNITDFVNGSATVYYRIFVFDRHGLSAGSNEVQLSK